MDSHAMCSLLVVLLFLMTRFNSGEQRAHCRTLYPPYAITADEVQYVSDPYEEGTWDGRMLASKHANGEDSLEILRLSINPGHGWLPHRHLEADEWMYVLSGSGAYTYWAFEEVVPTENIVGPGHALFNPQGQLHQVWNNGTEPLVLLAVSKSLAPYEVLGQWPETPGGGVGYVPHAAPWELSCAPGHEPDDDEPGFNDGIAGEWVGDGMEAAEVGYLEGSTLGESEAGSSLDSDYGYVGSPEEYGSCGMTAMSEGAIAECMAEPDMGNGYVEYDMRVYGGAYAEDADKEPEFPPEEAAKVEDVPPAHYEFGEL